MPPRVFAHRGASAVRHENTVEAFAEAVRMGAHGVELDVRRTAEGALVVHHDAHLPDGRSIVELRRSDLPDWVPDLAAAVDACAGIDVNIEVKNIAGDADWDPDESVAAAVARFVAERSLHDRVVVSSFNHHALDRVAAEDPSIRRGFLTPATHDQHRALDRVLRDGHHVLHPHHLAVNAELVEACHAAGVEVTTWTVDDPDRVRWLAGCGVDVIITNTPDAALAALAR